jgi:hypothetical protein
MTSLLYRDTVLAFGVDTPDIVGFRVEALDSPIGKVDKATNEAGSDCVLVDTGAILGRTVMLPSGVIRDIDLSKETVYVNRTEDEIKNAPEYDESLIGNDDYRDRLGSYYGPGGPGYRD